MRIRHVLGTIAAAALVAAAPTGSATAGGWHHFIPWRTVTYTLNPSTHGNPEGVTWHQRSRSFFVGATGDGTIYRGRLHNRTLRPFIAVDPAAGRSAIGMEAVGNKLYVAGGATGKVFVYRIGNRSLIGEFDTGAGGFLNDLVVTPRGHVYITDSFRPILWHITPAQLRARAGTSSGITLSPQITYIAGAFNLNGIEWFTERTLLAIQSSTGLMYRISLDRAAPGGRTITQLAAPPVPGGDGLIWDRGRLVVVAGDPAALTFFALKSDLSEGVITRVRSDPALRGPSTVAFARWRYLVVNADFTTSATPFTVAGLRAPLFHPWWEIPDDGGSWLAGDLKTRH